MTDDSASVIPFRPRRRDTAPAALTPEERRFFAALADRIDADLAAEQAAKRTPPTERPPCA